ncbi:hypothetical protein NDU88_010543 [Pleurodeles waltl]|uniref:Uncharacterized protein n=1 Tax=Pleurodeles waltl TaxID=8319 RepID=A0AAV7QXT6_PLEWA|nr:hypothetical protein NDU88_010543 [Pleurodeles waltl]
MIAPTPASASGLGYLSASSRHDVLFSTITGDPAAAPGHTVQLRNFGNQEPRTAPPASSGSKWRALSPPILRPGESQRAGAPISAKPSSPLPGRSI